MKKLLLILLSCLLLVGCSDKAAPDPEMKELELFQNSFGTELCGSLNEERSAYSVVIKRSVENETFDLLDCLNKFEEGEKEVGSNVTAIYVTYEREFPLSNYSLSLVREKAGDHFDAKMK